MSAFSPLGRNANAADLKDAGSRYATGLEAFQHPHVAVPRLSLESKIFAVRRR
jgi:hypothetical protein